MSMPYMDVRREPLRQLTGLVQEALGLADSRPFDPLHDYYKLSCGELALRLSAQEEDKNHQPVTTLDIKGIKSRISGINGIEPLEVEKRFEQTADTLRRLEQGKILGTATLREADLLVSMVRKDAVLHEINIPCLSVYN